MTPLDLHRRDDQATWRNAGLDRAARTRRSLFAERLFADDLDGTCVKNKAVWRTSRPYATHIGRTRNIVLIGDAAHTAFSRLLGTKLCARGRDRLVAGSRAYPICRKPRAPMKRTPAVVESTQRRRPDQPALVRGAERYLAGPRAAPVRCQPADPARYG